MFLVAITFLWEIKWFASALYFMNPEHAMDIVLDTGQQNITHDRPKLMSEFADNRFFKSTIC